MEDAVEPDIMVFQIHCPDAETARVIGQTLVAERLVACAHVRPPHDSQYRWKGEVVSETEVTLLIKSRADLTARLGERITDLHPYDVPAILGTKPDFVNAAFARWVAEETC